MAAPLREEAPLSVGILLFDQVEELDAIGPYETFKVASFHAADHAARERPALTVFTVAEHADLIRTSGGLRIQPDYSFADAPAIDILVIPGGNVEPHLTNPATLEWLGHVTADARINSSVCTGAFFLATLGLLDHRSATTHWGALDELASRFPTTSVRREVRWVDEGPVVTSAGISAGIDMSLHLVERLFGRAAAEETARMMEYRWDERAD
ncbi:MAG TPA: DJ-1/PfpI family protein [Ktedonobacterales bacterium]|jgi:transcriptional regulator GlxA family with amidase domain|nr:DJ-1/PfpI family protein [Ktedonobacterales bacterium]